MGTISPAVAYVFRLIRTDLYGHLDETDYLAFKHDEWSPQDAEEARKLISNLVLVIRGLLIEHVIQDSDDCLICTSQWPCPVVTTIHTLIKDPEHHFTTLLRNPTQP
ncbi:MAG: hypothetical protein ACT4NY_30230 [Pseudonocardiales bacterium]